VAPAKRDRKTYFLYAAAGNPRRTKIRAKRAIYGWKLIRLTMFFKGCPDRKYSDWGNPFFNIISKRVDDFERIKMLKNYKHYLNKDIAEIERMLKARFFNIVFHL